ncbi:MAG: hypothetical protein WBB41_10485 [Candidatus Nanopelagicales bacterium]
MHPVAPMPSAVPAPRATPRPELRPVTGFGGRTSDTLVHRSKKVKLTTLEVKVPKRVAKAAKQKAKARGQRLDDVVGAALLNYVDGL